MAFYNGLTPERLRSECIQVAGEVARYKTRWETFGETVRNLSDDDFVALGMNDATENGYIRAFGVALVNLARCYDHLDPLNSDDPGWIIEKFRNFLL